MDKGSGMVSVTGAVAAALTLAAFLSFLDPSGSALQGVQLAATLSAGLAAHLFRRRALSFVWGGLSAVLVVVLLAKSVN